MIAWLLALAAWAHPLDPGVLALDEQADGKVVVTWVPGPEDETSLPRLPAHCAGTVAEPVWRVDCGEEGLVGEVGIDGQVNDAVVRITRRDGEVRTAALRPGDRVRVDAPGTIASYLGLGIEHIAFGIDHLLFVAALVLVVRGPRRLVEAITAFTVGHSLTLGLATVGVLALPGPPVEALIAASIVVVAAAGLRETSLATHPWWLAAGFGLVHGLGFAGALRDVGLGGGVVAPLVGFNLGVEIGQLAFVALLLWPARWLRDRPIAQRLVATGVGAIAVFWTLERVSG